MQTRSHTVSALRGALRFLFYLAPFATTFGIYAVLCRFPGGKALNAEDIWLWALPTLAILYAVLRRSKAQAAAPRFGAAFPFAAFYWLLLLWAAVSLLWVRNPAASADGSLRYLFAGVLIATLFPAAVGRVPQLGTLLNLLALCYAVVVAVALFEMFTGIYFFTQNPNAHLYRNIYGLHFPYAVFYNMNDYASFVTLATPFVIYAAANIRRGILTKLAGTAAAYAGLYTVFNANARLCYFAVLVFAAAFTVPLCFARGMRSERRRIFCSAAIFAAAFALLFLTPALPIRGISSEFASINPADHSIVERSALTAAGLRMLWDSHLLGVGVGNSVPLMAQYSRFGAINLHAWPLQVAVEYGIIVWILYALMLVALGIRLVRAVLDTGLGVRERLLAAVCFGSLCAFQLVDFASSDISHVTVIWIFVGLWLATAKLTGRAFRRPAGEKHVAPRMLLDTFIDFGPMRSGSSVRPQRMDEAFRALGYDVVLLDGLQNRHRDRLRRVWRMFSVLRRDPPDFCYVEPPSGPFFNFCDHLLLLWLHGCGVPIGLFYRDAYWRFADWWDIKPPIKKFFLIQMQRFDLLIFRRVCRVIFFPTRSMAALFDLPRKSVLPPAGFDFITPPHPAGRRALYIGGVSGFYGTDILLEAFAHINETLHRDIRLTVVCRENEMKHFFDAYLGRPWLTIAHASGDDALRPFYEAADAALYPSRKDRYMDFCMPVKLCEYLSRGLPVVTTNCTEAAKFVTENGFGVATGECTPEALAQAVVRLFDTPGLLARCRENAVVALRERHLWTHRARQAANEILGAAAEHGTAAEAVPDNG